MYWLLHKRCVRVRDKARQARAGVTWSIFLRVSSDRKRLNAVLDGPAWKSLEYEEGAVVGRLLPASCGRWMDGQMG